MQVNIDIFSKSSDFFTSAVTPSRRHAVQSKTKRYLVTFCGIIPIKCAFIWICESFFVTLQVNRKQDATFVSGVIGGGNWKQNEEGAYKKSQTDDPINIASDPINAFSDPITEQLYRAILKDASLNYAEYATMIGVSEATVKRRLGELKKAGVIIRIGSNKTGHWQVK